jgi:hypothetical protein
MLLLFADANLLVAVRSFSHRSLPRMRFSRDLNLNFEF